MGGGGRGDTSEPFIINIMGFSVMQAARQTLQNKLNSTREQVKTMDATIDDYRKQLDEAKQVIHQKDTQVCGETSS